MPRVMLNPHQRKTGWTTDQNVRRNSICQKTTESAVHTLELSVFYCVLEKLSVVVFHFNQKFDHLSIHDNY